MTVEQVEIVHYKKKLVKLERKRRQWAQAFDQKLAAYRWAFTLTKESEAGIRFLRTLCLVLVNQSNAGNPSL
jgi:hypothetical protein